MTPLNQISDSDIIEEFQKRFELKAGDFMSTISETVLHLRSQFKERDREQFIIIFLNGRNQIIITETIFTGTLTSSAIYPREIVKSILKHEAAAVILAHNHPSGNKNPSKDDLVITKKIQEICNLIDVRVHDHIIITAEKYYSFADHGLI